MRIRQKGAGKFPAMENILFEDIKRRRPKAESCSQIWIKSRMHQLCEELKPENYNPEKDKFTDRWVDGFFTGNN